MVRRANLFLEEDKPHGDSVAHNAPESQIGAQSQVWNTPFRSKIAGLAFSKHSEMTGLREGLAIKG